MPISDEIIELEPIKKSKTKLIIMMVAMGVLFALAVTFLIMYVLKPNVEKDNGKIVDVSSIPSTLFSGTDENGNEVLTASVGNSYIVYADIVVEGDDVNSEILWGVGPAGAVRIDDKGPVTAEEQSLSDGRSGARGAATRYFCKFTPSDNISPNTLVKLTARSAKDAAVKTDIEFYIVKQGTENIAFRTMYHLQGGADLKEVDANLSEIELPYYSKSGANNTYTFQLEQLGKYDAATDSYSKLTINEIDGIKSNFLDISSSNASLVSVTHKSYSSVTGKDTFSFVINSSGAGGGEGANVATIIIKANTVGNYSDEYVKTLKVVVKTPSELGYVDEIRIYSQPVPADFGKKYAGEPYGKIPLSDTCLTMPYKMSNANIASHIVLLPLSIQYNKDGTRKDTSEWINKINIGSSNSAILTPSGSGANISFTANKLAGIVKNKDGKVTTGDCYISVKDVASGGEISSVIYVNIIANNLSGAPNVKTASGSTYTNTVTDKTTQTVFISDIVPTAPEADNTLSVLYSFTAPSDMKTDDFLSDKNYITKDYSVVFPEGVSVTAGGKNIISGARYELTDIMTVTHNGDGERFTGKFDLTVRFDRDIEKGDYTVVFYKYGTELGSIGTSTDKSWSVGVKFKVAPVVTVAEFVGNAEGTAIVTENGAKAGRFVAEDATTANLYIQNRGAAVKFPFSFKQLVYGYGVDGVDLNPTVALTVSGNSSTATINNVDSNGIASFTGKYAQSDQTLAGTAKIAVRNAQGADIGTLTVNIYVIDRINEAKLYENGKMIDENSEREIKYNASNNSSMVADIEQVGVFGEYRTSQTSATPILSNYDIGGNIRLAYFNGNAYVDFDTSVNGNDMDFTYNNGTETRAIYSYNTVSRKLSMKTPVFQYSYNYGVDVSKVKVTLSTKPYEYGGSAVSVSRVYVFIREADEFAVFSDADCANKLTGEYTVNQGETVSLYSSPIIRIKDINNQPFDVVVVNAKANSKTVATCEQSDFTIPDALYTALAGNIGGELSAPNTRRYVYANFTAPNAADAENGDKYDITVSKGGNGFKLVIKNQARKLVRSASFWKDEACTDTLTGLDFGKYNTSVATPYTAIIYIKLEYEDYTPGSSHFTKFEDVKLEVPESLEITTMQFKGEGAACVLGTDKRVAPNRLGAETAPSLQVLRCELKLKSDAKNTQTAGIEVTNTINTLTTETLPVNIGSGLKRVDFRDSDGNLLFGSDSESEKKLTFEFKNYDEIGTKDKLQLFKVSFFTISDVDDSYSFIDYDASKLTADAGLSASSCIQVNSTLTGDDPIITFGITKSNFFKLDNELVTLTLTDTSGGGNRVFTFKFRITVKLEIYDLKLSGNNVNITTTGKKLDGVQPPDLENEEDTVGYWSKSSVVAPIFNGSDIDGKLAPSDEYLQFLSARIEIKGDDGKYVRYGTDGAPTDIIVVYNKTDGKMNGMFTVYAANNTAFKVNNLFLHVWYREYSTDTDEADTVFESRIPITISTSSNGLRPVNGSLGDSASKSVVINVASKTDEFNFAVEPYNLGSEVAADHAEVSKIVYSLYADAGRTSLIYSTATPNADTSVTANINASGILRLVDPKNRNGYLYFRASYLDESSGELRVVDKDIEYKIEINSVTITKGQYTFDGGVFTLYYGGQTQYTQMSNLRQFFELSTDFENAAVTGNAWNFTVAVESGGENIIHVTNGLNGAVGSIKAVGIGKTKITVDFVGKYGGKVSKTFDVDVVSLDAAIDITADGEPKINILQNSALNVTAEVNTLKGIDVAIEFTTSGGLSIGTTDALTVNNNRASSSAPVTLERKAYRDSSDYNNKTITVRITYTKKADAKSELISGSVVGPVVFSKTFTVTPVNDFDSGFDFDLYRTKDGATVKIGESETIDNGATYSVKLNKIVADSEYSGIVSNGIAFGAASSNNVINLKGGGNFAAGSDTLQFTFDPDATGAVTVTVTPKVYGKQFGGIQKTYTFTRGEKATAAMLHSSNGGGSYSPLTFVDGKMTKPIDYSSTGDNPNVFKYEIDASKVGMAVTVSDVSVEYTGDVTVLSPLASAGDGKFAIIFRAGKRSTKLIVSGSVRVNNKTYYTEKYELELTVAQITPVLEFTSSGSHDSVKPCDRLTFGVKTDSSDFKGNIGVVYTVENGGSYAAFGTGTSDKNVLTIASSVTENVRLLVCATVTVTGGALDGAVYTLYNEINVIGVPFPTVEWSAPVIEYDGTSVRLGDNITVNNNGNNSVTHSFAVDDAAYGSADYDLPANGILTIRDTDKTRGGGRLRVKVTVTVGGTAINAGSKVEAFAYVEWSAFTYGVKFNLDGGNIDGSTATVTKTQTFGGNYILPPAPTKTGHEFLGWYDGTTKITAETIVDITAEKTLVAKWQAKTYVMTLVEDAGSRTVNVTYGGKFTAIGTGTAPTGRIFNYWCTSRDGTGDKFAPTDTVAITGDITLFAYYTLKNYSVTLNGNGGTPDKTGALSIAYSTSYDLGGATRVGYKFVGWFDTADAAGGNKFDTVGAWTHDGDITLYARWDVEQYTVTLDANGGALTGGDNFTVTYGGTYSALGGVTAPTRAGYEFLGWFTQPTGGDKVESTAAVSVNADHKLYAHWAQNEFRVTLNANGGTLGGDGYITVDKDGKYDGLNANTPTRTGYNFDGWYTQPSGGDKVESNTAVTMNADHTLYAHWVSTSSYTVSLELGADDAECDISSIDVQGKTKYEGLPTPTREGYVFSGWSTDIDGNNKVKNGDTIALSGNFWNKVPTYKTLYASWNRESYNIEFNGTSIANGKYAFGDMLPVPTASGKTFVGWYKDSAFATAIGSTVPDFGEDNATVTVFAKWENNTYTVMLNPNGGSINSVYIEVEFGNTYILGTPTRDGHKFIGWFDTSDVAGGTEFPTSGTFGKSENVTLWARWEIKKYSFTFENSAVTSAELEYGATLPVPTADGKIFVGWYEEDTFATAVGSTVGDFGDVAEITLYAKWVDIVYTVTLDADGGTLLGQSSFVFNLKYGDTLDLTTLTPEKVGHKFVGWQDGDGNSVTTLTVDGTEDGYALTAVWQKERYTLKFDLGYETTDTVADVTAEYGESVALETPTRDGHVFGGWFTEENGGGVEFDGATIDDLGDDGATVTLFAKWTEEVPAP